VGDGAAGGRGGAGSDRVKRRPPSAAEQRRAVWALAVAVAVLLFVLPVTLLVRASLSNPLADQLDELALPAAVDLHHSDAGGQSRYCVDDCAWLKRTYQSGQPVQQTDAAFRAALTEQGWRLAGGTCPKPTTGSYSCWSRDQYALDLYVRPGSCAGSGYQPLPQPSESRPPAQDDIPPSAEPTPSGPVTAQCPASVASAQVNNVADPQWRSVH
jgi:integrin beta 3